MINNSQQTWEIGQLVKVGFLTNLKVIKKIPTPKDYMPDAYLLSRQDSKGNTKFYEFVPHNGLSAVTNSHLDVLLAA
jgi:hypothetical protein